MDHEHPVNVAGYDKSRGIDQAISVTTMNNNLLAPMQIRMNDVELNNTPRFLTKNHTSKTHAISGLNHDDHEYIIPLTLHSVTSYIPT